MNTETETGLERLERLRRMGTGTPGIVRTDAGPMPAESVVEMARLKERNKPQGIDQEHPPKAGLK